MLMKSLDPYAFVWDSNISDSEDTSEKLTPLGKLFFGRVSELLNMEIVGGIFRCVDKKEGVLLWFEFVVTNEEYVYPAKLFFCEEKVLASNFQISTAYQVADIFWQCLSECHIPPPIIVHEKRDITINVSATNRIEDQKRVSQGKAKLDSNWNNIYALSNISPFLKNMPFRNTLLGEQFFKGMEPIVAFPIVTGMVSILPEKMVFNLFADLHQVMILQKYMGYREANIYKLHAPFSRAFFHHFVDCCAKCNLPLINDVIDSENFGLEINIKDFRSSFVASDFGNRVLAINEKISKRYPVTICMGENSRQLFFICYERLYPLAEKELLQQLSQIIEEVTRLCRIDDPLELYSDPSLFDGVTVTSKDQLRREGQLMGVMRNNPHLK